MNVKYHIEITRKALSNHFSEKALRTILRANINQDSIKNQINHDHFHFDSNTFKVYCIPGRISTATAIM